MSPREKQARARLDRALIAYHELARTFGRDPMQMSNVAIELRSAEVGLYEILRCQGKAE